ncbi:hypothetical protein DKM44_00890 [Deinococcus irradiatisoli]|uniref:HTH lysR-type domain-containing protein n=1 Tax=Deinococcus irradiatisoli TaxID=2202254 RepID=A0A2Z3JGC3_9DEIO|nr:LysR family transcriptional regulator [Deinococcus irradiatisoli]AWN21969.1 hypothetical protein DKM44_00890 [Deinococcus irradiatisoli]
MTDFTLAQVRVLLAVVKTGSFTAAAIETNLTQSGVSHAIRGLEEALGVRLFERHGRGAQLTDAGLRALPIARHLLDEAQRLPLEAQAASALSGRVVIASFPSLAQALLPRVLAQLRAEAPQLELQVRDDFLERYAVEAAVLRGDADIGLTQLPAHPRLLARPLLTDPFELLWPAAWPLSWSSALQSPSAQWRSAALWKQPYLHLGPDADDFVLRGLRRVNLPVRPQLSLLSENVIVAMVAQGLGYAVLPQLALDERARGPLPPAVLRGPLPFALVRTLGSVTRPGELSPAGRAVLGMVWAAG